MSDYEAEQFDEEGNEGPEQDQQKNPLGQEGQEEQEGDENHGNQEENQNENKQGEVEQGDCEGEGGDNSDEPGEGESEEQPQDVDENDQNDEGAQIDENQAKEQSLGGENQSKPFSKASQKQEVPDIKESDYQEQSFDKEELKDLNLSGIDAVSVKVEPQKGQKASKKQTKSAAGKSQQEMMVKDLMKKHKEKQQKLKKREDDIYVQEQIAKKLPKPAQPPQPKPVVKQKLVFDKKTQEQLDDPKKTNQEKAAILTKDLAKKLDKPVVVKAATNQIEIKKPGKGSEAKPKQNQFDLRLGPAIKSKLDKDSEEQSKKDQKKERELFLVQKKQMKEKELQQLKEQDEMLRVKQQEMVLQQQKALDRENKVLIRNNEKIEDQKCVMEAQKKQKEYEKQEDLRDVIKKEEEILKALKREHKSLQQEVDAQEREIKHIDAQIDTESRKDNVINLGGKYVSLRKIKLKSENDWLQEVAVSGESSQVKQVGDLGEPDISTKVLNKIAQNGLELKDAYALLDEDKDGVLTIKEIQNNISKLNLNLNEVEVRELINLLDQNSDGVLTEQEFIQYLTQGLEIQKDFIKIMGDIKDILNPLVLEERRLHLKYLQRYLQKKIEEETLMENEKLPKYKRLVKKLKKTEELIESLKGTSSDKGMLKQQLEGLRKELRVSYDNRNKQQNQMREKREMVEENIAKMTQKLGELSYQVLQKKETIRKQSIYTQKLQLKLLAFEQIQLKFQKEMQEKHQLELQAGQKQLQLENVRLSNQTQLKEMEMKMQQNLHYVIIIQKFTRGKIMQKKLKSKLSGLKACAKMLVQLFLKKHKQYKVQFLMVLENNQKAYYRKLEQAKEQQMRQKIKDKEQSKEQKFVMNQLKKQVAKQKTEFDQYTEILPKIIRIQKQIRFKKYKTPISDKVFNITFVANQDTCQSCQTDLAELICKACQQPLYCDACFRIGHKSYKRRNHEYYKILRKVEDHEAQMLGDAGSDK